MDATVESAPPRRGHPASSAVPPAAPAPWWHPLDPRRSLRARTCLLFGAATLLLSVALSGLAGATAHAGLERQIGQSLEDFAYQLSDKLDRGLFERVRDVQIAVSILPSQGDRAERRALLEKFQQTFPAYAWIGFADPSGQVLFSTGGVLEGVNVASRPWFQRARERPFVGEVHEAVLLGRQLAASAAQEPPRFVDVAAPAFDSRGQFLGVLGAHLYWQWAREVHDSLFADGERRGRVGVTVLGPGQASLLETGTERGFSAVGSPPPAGPAGRPEHGCYRAAGPDGTRFLVGYARSHGYRDFPGLGWTILVRQPIRQALAPARALQRGILAAGGVLGLLCAAAGWFLANGLVGPLRQIAAAAARIRHGDARTRIPVVPGSDEAAELSAALVAMVDELRAQRTALATANAGLEERVTRRTAELHQVNRTLQGANGRLTEVNQQLEAFTATVSHDLRAPLRVIQGYAQALLEDCGPELTSRAADYAQRLAAASLRMGRLIEDLLQYSRLGQAEIELYSVRLPSVVREALDAHAAGLRERGGSVALALDDVPPVHGHRLTLLQVFDNLLGNALKFVPADRPPRLRVWAQARGGDLRVCVADNGIGIDPQYFEKIFGVFTRLHRQNDYPGTGIGLAIVRKALERMGGRCGVESTPGEGSCFWIELPAATPTTAAG